MSRFPGSDAARSASAAATGPTSASAINDTSSRAGVGRLLRPRPRRRRAVPRDPDDRPARRRRLRRRRLCRQFNGTSSATPCVAGLAALDLEPASGARRNVERPRDHRDDVRQDLAGPVRLRQRRAPSRAGRGTTRSATAASTPSGRCSRRARRSRAADEGAVPAAAAGAAARTRPRNAGARRRCPGSIPHRCMYFYEARDFDVERVDDRRRSQLRVTLRALPVAARPPAGRAALHDDAAAGRGGADCLRVRSLPARALGDRAGCRCTRRSGRP